MVGLKRLDSPEGSEKHTVVSEDVGHLLKRVVVLRILLVKVTNNVTPVPLQRERERFFLVQYQLLFEDRVIYKSLGAVFFVSVALYSCLFVFYLVYIFYFYAL